MSGRIAVAIKIGDQGTASTKDFLGMRDGMPVEMFYEDSWGVSLEEIFGGTSRMNIAYAILEITADQAVQIAPMVKPTDEDEAVVEKILKGEKDKETYRIRTMMLDFKKLGSLIGNKDIESQLRAQGANVPTINLTSYRTNSVVGLFHDAKDHKLTDPKIPDKNAISSGNYTIGVSKNYSTLTSAWADLDNLQGDLNFDLQTAITQTVATSGSAVLHGHTLSHTSNYKHYGDPTRDVNLVSVNYNASMCRLEFEGPGTLTFSDWYMKRVTTETPGSSADFKLQNTDIALDIYFSNIMHDGNGLINGCLYSYDVTPTIYLKNFKVWDCNDAGFYIENGNANSVYENITIYNSTNYWGFRVASGQPGKANRIASFGGADGDFDMGSFSIFNKCASSDASGSEAGLRNLVAANCFVSLDDTNTEFLKIKSSGALAGGANSTSYLVNNVVDIAGYSRPSTGSIYSVGANELENTSVSPSASTSPSSSPSPSTSPSSSESASRSPSSSLSPSSSASSSASPSLSPSSSVSASRSPSSSASMSLSPSSSVSPSISPSSSVSPSISPSSSESASTSPSSSSSASQSPSSSASQSVSPSSSPSPSTTSTPSFSQSPSSSESSSVSPSLSPSSSESSSMSPSYSPSGSYSPSASTSPSISPSRSISPSVSPSGSISASLSPSSSASSSRSPSSSMSKSRSPSSSASASRSPSGSMSPSSSMSASESPAPPVPGEVYFYDCAIKAGNVFAHQTPNFVLTMSHCETNKLESSYDPTVASNCNFESEALDTLPEAFIAAEFPANIGSFIYDTYNIQNDGSGITFWTDNDILYGMLGTLRYGIGYFYFYISVPNPSTPNPIIKTSTTDNNFPPKWETTLLQAHNLLGVPETVIKKWNSARYGV